MARKRKTSTEEPVSNNLPLGARLRSQRIAMGLSLDDAAKASGVRTEFLSALERHDLAALPTVGYGLGYVRAYARTLGLDTEQSVVDFKRDSAVPFDLNRANQPHFVPSQRVRLPRGTIPALGVVMAVIALGAWYGVQLEAATSPVPAETVSTFDPNADANAAPVPDSVLTLRTTAPSWVSIRNEQGQLIVNRVFVTGDIWQTDVGQLFTLDVRDAGAVEYYIGETPRGSFGTPGTPRRDIDLSALR